MDAARWSLGIRRGDAAVAREQEGGQAETVGAEEAGVGRGEALDDLRAGMAEGVLRADGDDRILRGGERQELWSGGSPAAVVADFEQGVGAERRGGIGRIRSRSLRCAAG